MNGDLISRSALLKEMRTSGRAAYMIVQEAPAVDAVPVRHGRWINEVELHPELYGWVPLNGVVCSECGRTNGMEKPYCHNCGAKMDKEADK